MLILELHRQGLSITAIALGAPAVTRRRCANTSNAGSSRQPTVRAKSAGRASLRPISTASAHRRYVAATLDGLEGC